MVVEITEADVETNQPVQSLDSFGGGIEPAQLNSSHTFQYLSLP